MGGEDGHDRAPVRAPHHHLAPTPQTPHHLAPTLPPRGRRRRGLGHHRRRVCDPPDRRAARPEHPAGLSRQMRYRAPAGCRRARESPRACPHDPHGQRSPTKRRRRDRREQKQTARERPRGGAVRGAVRHRRDGRADDQPEGGQREPHEELDDAPGEETDGACGSAPASARSREGRCRGSLHTRRSAHRRESIREERMAHERQILMHANSRLKSISLSPIIHAFWSAEMLQCQ